MSCRQNIDLATADGHDRYVPSELRDIVSAGHEGVYEWVADNLVRDGTRFLDLGCGTGYGAAVVTAAGGTYDGVDTSPAAIEYAQINYGRRNTRFFVADATEPGPQTLVPRSYDVVFSSEVLEHVTDPFAFVRVMAGFVTEEGIGFVGTPNRLWSLDNMPNGALVARSHVMEFTPPALVALLETVFEEVSLLFRMFPQAAIESTVLPSTRRRLVRGAAAFAQELAPNRFSRWRQVLGHRRPGQEWSSADIRWLGAGDPQLDMSRCLGLAAVCKAPKR